MILEKIKALFKRTPEPVFKPTTLLQLESTNRTPYTDPTIRLKTSLLPVVYDNEMYETCIFFMDGSSEVLDRYPDELTARMGHEYLRKDFGLNKPKEMYQYEFIDLLDGK